VATSKTDRCLRLLRALDARGALTTAEAARLLGVDRETALRDLSTVREAVPEVAREGEGRDRRWRLRGQERASVTFGQQLALHFGRELMRFMEGTVVPGWLDELGDKLATVSWRSERGAARLARRFHFVSEPYRPYDAHDGTIDTLMRALLHDREVEITYREGRAYARFQPYTVVVYRRALYLLGRVPGTPGLLTLAVDRIVSARLGERAFRLPSSYTPADALGQAFGIRRDPPAERVVLRFPAAKRRYVEARRWHASAVVRDAADGRVELEMHAGGEELVNLALEWGAACEVVEPAWLRAKVIAELEGALRVYAPGSVSGGGGGSGRPGA
jgi:predicted DNA-binding transcriptional regulator YafY